MPSAILGATAPITSSVAPLNGADVNTAKAPTKQLSTMSGYPANEGTLTRPDFTFPPTFRSLSTSFAKYGNCS